MKTDMAVNISGTVLASLYYDNSSSIGDQTGFLIGEVVHHIHDTISDSQINNREVKTKTYVFECLRCPKDQLFYNGKGDIQVEKVKDLLRDKHKKVVGWYCFRRNSTIRPSFRERLLHYNLTRTFVQDGDKFLFLLCSAKTSTNRSTHTFDHSFLHVDNDVFKKVPVEITNLGDTTHTEYRSEASHTVDSTHGAFSRIVQSHEGEFLNTFGQMEVKKVQMLNGAIRRQLDSISQTVIDSEAKCSDLEQEVAMYRKRAKLKLLEQQQQALQQQKGSKVSKGPSVDDILSMDQVDDLPSEILVGQGQKERTKGERSKGDVELKSSTGMKQQDMETESNLLDRYSDMNEKKTHPVKLTAPAQMHSRSSSLPVDTSNINSSQLNTAHTRSKSGDASEEKSKPVKNDTKGNNSEDPFDFVGSMLAESKKDTQKSHNLGQLKKKDTSVDMETEEPIPSKFADQRQTRHKDAAVSAAKSFNPSTRLTRGQKLKGQEQVTESVVGKGQISNNLLHENTEEGDGLKFEKSKNHGNLKTCGQEVTEIMTDEDSTSQDNYEMDVSASPVY
ncbi:uncharacterized protein LOC132724345 [Ruditapes philippinarum]|uniref:uncharacterized protein LOC132724345 n=1 Tax=Ruditapes philippinarum TaxID=129788 RepID=UPI00295B00B0|nr:uncharacterized protein LOC132724345 [Ruditapes philippinarum]